MEAATLSGGETFTQRSSVEGRRSVIVPTQVQSNHALVVNQFLTLFILRDIGLKCVLTPCPYIPHIMKC